MAGRRQAFDNASTASGLGQGRHGEPTARAVAMNTVIAISVLSSMSAHYLLLQSAPQRGVARLPNALYFLFPNGW